MDIRTYDAGEIIGSFKPFVYCLQYDQLAKRCETCLKLSKNLLKCSSCKITHYCNKTCQKSLWKFHKNECSSLLENCPKFQNYPAFLFLCLRLITKLETDKNSNPSEIVFGKSRSFDDLKTHIIEIMKDTKKMSDYKTVLSFLISRNSLIALNSPDKILKLFCKLVINNFLIVDNDLRFIGMGLYIGGSIFNHSCCSNAVAMFHGNELIVRALRKINKGEEITISYSEQMEPTHIRRQKLLDSHFFHCLCEMCLNEELTKDMSLIYCLKESNNSFFTDNTGTIAGNICDHEQCLDILNIFVNIEYYRKIQTKTEDAKELLTLYKDVTKKYGVIAKYLNFYSYSYHDLAFELCIQLKKWNLAIHHGEVMLHILKKVFVGNHPRLALHLAKLGKILANNDNLPEAIKFLQKASDMLTVTHGYDNETTLEVNQLLLEYKLEVQLTIRN